MRNARRPLKERFEEKFIPEPNTGCWIWIASTNEHGYGVIGSGGKNSKKHHNPVILAHRASWTIYNGEIPVNMQILHQCDNPFCVNPSHLFLGSHLTNMRDKVLKNRQPKHFGTSNPNHKLSESQVLEIRHTYQTKAISIKNLAIEYRVNPPCIGRIVRGQSWVHLLTR